MIFLCDKSHKPCINQTDDENDILAGWIKVLKYSLDICLSHNVIIFLNLLKKPGCCLILLPIKLLPS